VIQTVTHTIERPLFPAYAFVARDEDDPWVPIRYAPGVHSLLMANGKPQMVRYGAVEALQATEDARCSPPPPNSQWRPGSAVRVAMGIFTGMPGVVTKVGIAFGGTDMAFVSLMFLGHLREISLPLDCLTSRDDG
jgi:transcription antitermination factor NusG